MGTPDKGLKILKERVSHDRFPHEFLLHLVIVHRILDERLVRFEGYWTVCAVLLLCYTGWMKYMGKHHYAVSIHLNF